MEKGKFGVRICFYTVLAFVLAALGYSTALFLVAGVVLLAEKSEWGTRQVIQAVFLCFFQSVVSSVMSVFDFMFDIPFLSTVWRSVDNAVSACAWILVLAFCVVGILKNTRGEDASIPFVAKIADWAFGIVTEPKVAAPVQQAPTQQAPAQQAPVQQAPIQQQAPVDSTTQKPE